MNGAIELTPENLMTLLVHGSVDLGDLRLIVTRPGECVAVVLEVARISMQEAPRAGS